MAHEGQVDERAQNQPRPASGRVVVRGRTAIAAPARTTSAVTENSLMRWAMSSGLPTCAAR